MMKARVWQGVGGSKQMIDTIEVGDGVNLVRTSDGRLYARNTANPHQFNEVEVPTVTPYLPDEGPKPGEWFGQNGFERSADLAAEGARLKEEAAKQPTDPNDFVGGA